MWRHHQGTADAGTEGERRRPSHTQRHPARGWKLLVVPALLAAAALSAPALLSGMEPPELVELGTLERGTTTGTSVTLRNDESAVANLHLLPSDPSLTVSPARFQLAPGEEQTVAIDLAVPEDATGTSTGTGAAQIVRLVTVFYEGTDRLPSTIEVRGRLEPQPVASSGAANESAGTGSGGEVTSAAAQAPAVAADDAAPVRIDLYMDISCPSCRELAEETIPSIVEEYGATLDQQVLDVMNASVMERLMRQLRSRGLELDSLPVAVVTLAGAGAEQTAGSQARSGRSESIVFQGFEGIEEGLAASLERRPTAAVGGEQDSGGTTVFSAGAIIGAGLMDGVNPCAFSTMLFLISMLALVGRSRREILLIGSIYTATIFVGYLATGFGLFASVRALMVFPVIVQGIRWLLVAVLLILAVLSFRDAFLARAGRMKEMTLQLPERMKQRVHGVIRSGTRSTSLIGGTILLGLGVTVFEFSCTGQVYVPVIMYLARSGSAQAVGLLLLYNTAFIVPLLLVFGLAYAGVSMKRIGTLFEKNVAVVKVGLGIVFTGLAVMTLLM